MVKAPYRYIGTERRFSLPNIHSMKMQNKVVRGLPSKFKPKESKDRFSVVKQ